VLKHSLQTWGYWIIVALDPGDALQRAQEGDIPFYLILLNQCERSIEEMITLGQQIRQNTVPDNRVPIIIVAERYGADLEGQGIQVGNNEYVTYLEDGQQLRNILQRVCLSD